MNLTKIIRDMDAYTFKFGYDLDNEWYTIRIRKRPVKNRRAFMMREINESADTIEKMIDKIPRCLTILQKANYLCRFTP